MLQAERIKTALVSMSGVLEELRQGYVDDDCLQDAVYLQGVVNSIVWKLNDVYYGGAGYKANKMDGGEDDDKTD